GLLRPTSLTTLSKYGLPRSLSPNSSAMTWEPASWVVGGSSMLIPSRSPSVGGKSSSRASLKASNDRNEPPSAATNPSPAHPPLRDRRDAGWRRPSAHSRHPEQQRPGR